MSRQHDFPIPQAFPPLLQEMTPKEALAALYQDYVNASGECLIAAARHAAYERYVLQRDDLFARQRTFRQALEVLVPLVHGPAHPIGEHSLLCEACHHTYARRYYRGPEPGARGQFVCDACFLREETSGMEHPRSASLPAMNLQEEGAIHS